MTLLRDPRKIFDCFHAGSERSESTIWKILRHARHNVIAYIALAFAMSGTAAAAVPFMQVGDPNPVIADGALRSKGISVFSGTLTADLAPLAPNTCSSFGTDLHGAQRSDVVVFVPIPASGFFFPDEISVQGRIQITSSGFGATADVCNISASVIDLPATTFRYLVLR